jgi:hypothetical protein
VTPTAVLRDNCILKALSVLILAGVPICRNVPYDMQNRIPVISDFNIAIIPIHLVVFGILKDKERSILN